MRNAITTIDSYIALFPKNSHVLLVHMRKTIKKAAPNAKEAIKYGIPTFVLGGNLVHFAAYPQHIGFYPSPSGIRAFKKELSKYKTSKGAIQFPLDQPLPLSLIAKIVKFRVKEAMEHTDGPFSGLVAPARRALVNAGITTLKKLSTYTESEILGLHGMGKSTMPKLREALRKEKLSFK